MKIIFSLSNHNYEKYPIIIFEIKNKRNNENLTRKKKLYKLQNFLF